MTTPETPEETKDEILATLKAIRSIISWIGIHAVTGFAVVIWAMVIDHFDQVDLRKDDNYMKPRVTRLWIQAHPEIQRDEMQP